MLQELMEHEVIEFAGPKDRHCHNARREPVRHGVENGYVFLGDRRVRTTTGQEIPLNTYETFQDDGATQAILQRMLFGLASR